MNRYIFNEKDLANINKVVSEVCNDAQSDADLYYKAKDASLELPLMIRKKLNEFKDESIGSHLILSGFDVNDTDIGPTPSTTKPDIQHRITREDTYLALIAALLGFPFSFATQQKGRLIQNIVPMKSAENSQLGAGSKEGLVWHTEDAFHPHRPDYIVLMGLRNPENIATTVAEIPNNFSEEEIELLFSKNFHFIPDPDHAKHLKNWKTNAEKISYSKMQQFIKKPVPQAVLYGSRDKPYLRLDPIFTNIVDKEHPSTRVYEKLLKAIDNNLLDISLKSGDILILDNHLSVHGRRPFVPKYNGNDRWLKKINITLDAKKSKAFRHHSNSFVI